jgi:hypothetical protein
MAKLECSHGLCHTVVTDGVNGRVEREECEDGSVYVTATCHECYADDHRDDQALVDAESGAATERYLDWRYHSIHGDE